jgi:hypothetical protein
MKTEKCVHLLRLILKLISKKVNMNKANIITTHRRSKRRFSVIWKKKISS